MGILRSTLVIGAIFAAMPTPPKDAGPPVAGGSGPGAFTYVTAAADAFADVRGFCLRKPGVCNTANYIASSVEAKAKYSVKLVYEWANAATAEDHGVPLPRDLAQGDQLITSSVAALDAPVKAGSQSTLLLSDIIPDWKAPKPLKKG